MKLADIVDVFIAGDWGNESLSNDTPNAVFCIRGADIMSIRDHKYTDIPKRYISKRAKETKLLKVGDLVIEKSGGSPIQSTGRITYISEDLIQAKKELVCSNFSIGIRVKSCWNPLYVYYYWQYIYNLGVFFNFESKTSGIKNLQLDSALEAIAIEEIPLEVQNQIVATLSSYDHKIALNRAINHNLAAMAKQLYDYWFVQFDFPNEEGKPYKSSGGKMVWNEKLKREIPEGWEVIPLFEGIDVQYGFPFSTDSFLEETTDVPIVRIRDIINGTISAYSTEKIDEKFKLKKGDIVVGMDGNFHMNYWHTDKAYLNQRCVRLRPKKDSSISSIQIYYDIQPFIKAKEKSLKGSTVGHLLDKDLKELYILNSNTNLRNIFDYILLKILTGKIEYETLTKQRDELLPLLMNGQARIG